ncbi:MAG: hypothetical protein ABH805_02425 [Candidatus Nealsonbacteria bacterium]
MLPKKFNSKAWVVAVDMGYGHQRTAYPLRSLSQAGQVINANSYSGIAQSDWNTWQKAKGGYEFVSAFSRTPIIGPLVFGFFNRLQRILDFYPLRDLSKPNIQLRQTLAPIKKGWGRHLVEKLAKNPLPLVGTFFTIAFMAEEFKYPGEIYCVVCDTDISRTWAPVNPKKSKIKYFAPTPRVVERLKLYGVNPKNIFLTGYPLPQENIGTEKMEILKKDLKQRLVNLDPKRSYYGKYKDLIKARLGNLPKKSDHPLTIMFAVGGAGAQKRTGVLIARALSDRIKKKEIKLVLVAGIRKDVQQYFKQETKGLPVEIIFAEDTKAYFRKFNAQLRKTDILWTKPSELSFYSALGVPIIIAPPIGSQEDFNKRWLVNSGFGTVQKSLSSVDQWLFQWLDNGFLAEYAMQGFIEGEKMGTLNIMKKVCSG